MSARLWCPYHSTLGNAALYPASHPCFTIYDDPGQAEVAADA